MATLEQVNKLLEVIQTGIANLSDEKDADLLARLNAQLVLANEVLTAAQSESQGKGVSVGLDSSGMGGRRRSAKKRGTQRKQKRRQRRGSRHAY